jgi:hypothetical protein
VVTQMIFIYSCYIVPSRWSQWHWPDIVIPPPAVRETSGSGRPPGGYLQAVPMTVCAILTKILGDWERRSKCSSCQSIIALSARTHTIPKF